MSTRSTTSLSIVTEAAIFIGSDYHSRAAARQTAAMLRPTGVSASESTAAASGTPLMPQAAISATFRIEHHSPHDFATLVKR